MLQLAFRACAWQVRSVDTPMAVIINPYLFFIIKWYYTQKIKIKLNCFLPCILGTILSKFKNYFLNNFFLFYNFEFDSIYKKIIDPSFDNTFPSNLLTYLDYMSTIIHRRFIFWHIHVNTKSTNSNY